MGWGGAPVALMFGVPAFLGKLMETTALSSETMCEQNTETPSRGYDLGAQRGL